MPSDDTEWLRVYWIIGQYFSEVDVLDTAELTNLIVGKRDE
jgi:hypothetical protein